MTAIHQYMKHENTPDSHESKLRTWGGGIIEVPISLTNIEKVRVASESTCLKNGWADCDFAQIDSSIGPFLSITVDSINALSAEQPAS